MANLLVPRCELCDRQAEVDVDTAEVFGWVQTWDGWLCPKHAKECAQAGGGGA